MQILHTKTLQSRLQELEKERDEWIANLTPEDGESIAKKFWLSPQELTAQDILDEWEDSSDGLEWKQISQLKEDIGEHFWDQGISLIEDWDFEEFAQSEARNMGVDIDFWPATHINWSHAANDLKHDYKTVDYDYDTYYYRA